MEYKRAADIVLVDWRGILEIYERLLAVVLEVFSSVISGDIPSRVLRSLVVQIHSYPCPKLSSGFYISEYEYI